MPDSAIGFRDTTIGGVEIVTLKEKPISGSLYNLYSSPTGDHVAPIRDCHE